MSYILDALKKAAEQRNGPPPEVRRLLSQVPVVVASPLRSIAVVAAAAGAIAVTAVMWAWPVPPAKPIASAIAVPAPDASSRVPSEPPRATTLEPRAAATAPRAAETKPPRARPLVAAAPTVSAPAPSVVASLPPGSTPAAPRTDIARLKVEVIVYSDLRPQRWAFINGRKYVEGDTIGEGARVEEIQSTGVVIVEDGRRITLRP